MGALVLAKCEICRLFCVLTAFNLFLVWFITRGKKCARKCLKMKTPLTSQSVGRKAIIINPKIMKKINRVAKVQNFSQKTAESCGDFIFLTTFAKRLKDRELG